MILKPQSRIMGVDDGAYVRGSRTTIVVMTIWRIDGYLDGVLTARIATDGDDSADVIGGALVSSRFRTQVRCIISDGGCLGGFNVLDMDRLREVAQVPVITTSDEAPDGARFVRALEASGLDPVPRMKAIDAHPPFVLALPDGRCYVRASGMTEHEAAMVVRRTVVRGRNPEPVRIAHLIAGALPRGEV